ncbi:transposase family protein [Nostoc sp. ChiVER01]|uniref:transposase family protein n=1 Tax=Nostoc sp. ChiVER01 TaxID=3075382 RepID=UPI002AD271CB|nr:transposase family protein [Nostoc sp. ChiVER01]MDZ8227117.1 transposase family protein [Nostoc sp. ChiVER01]
MSSYNKFGDYRHIRGGRHELWLVLLLTLLGAMTGYWGYRPLEDFTLTYRQRLIELLNLKDTTKFPCYSTFRRVMTTVNFQLLTELFNTWQR